LGISIWGFVQLGIHHLGIRKKFIWGLENTHLGICTINRHLRIEKYIWGYTFGDAKKCNWGFKK
jgi:hypothetical protein